MAKSKQKVLPSLLKKSKLVELDSSDFQTLYLGTFERLSNTLHSSDLAHEYLFKTITIIVLNRGNKDFKKLLSTLNDDTSNFDSEFINKSKAFSTVIKPFESLVVELTGMQPIDFVDDMVENILSSFICELSKDKMLKLLIDNEGFSHHGLCSAYENVMSHLDVEMQKESGSIYTPKEIANYICYEVLNNYVKDKIGVDIDSDVSELDKNTLEKLVDCLTNITILEPSMGAGVIFIEMLDYLVEKIVTYKNYLKELEGEHELTSADKLAIHLSILKNMYGTDIDKTALTLAKNCILLKLYTLGYNKAEIGLNVCCVDTALKGMPKYKSFNTGSNSGFKCDIVIGNPPYIRSKNISEVDKGVVKNYSVYHGNADLLCYFYELGFNLLKDGGVLGFITSNKWLTANYGEPLRVFIIDKCELIGILDFKGNRVFKGIGVDTEITFLRKRNDLSSRNKDFWYCDGTGYRLECNGKDEQDAESNKTDLEGF